VQLRAVAPAIALSGVALGVALGAVLGVGLRPPAPAPAPPIAGRIVAHRAGRPENTLAAVDRAAGAGYTAIELDVRRRETDGAVVCAHDAEQAGPEAPTLGAMLDRALGHGLLVELDTKTSALGDRALVRDVIAEIVARDARGRVWVTAFQLVAAWQVRREDPTVALGWPVPSTDWRAADAVVAALGAAAGRWLGASVLEPEAPLASAARLARWERAWRERGGAVEVWTVADPVRVDALRAAGAAVVVDLPADPREQLAR